MESTVLLATLSLIHNDYKAIRKVLLNFGFKNVCRYANITRPVTYCSMLVSIYLLKSRWCWTYKNTIPGKNTQSFSSTPFSGYIVAAFSSIFYKQSYLPTLFNSSRSFISRSSPWPICTIFMRTKVRYLWYQRPQCSDDTGNALAADPLAYTTTTKPLVVYRKWREVNSVI